MLVQARGWHYNFSITTLPRVRASNLNSYVTRTLSRKIVRQRLLPSRRLACSGSNWGMDKHGIGSGTSTGTVAGIADHENPLPVTSKRVKNTDTPCIVQMQRMLRESEDVMSLAQGIVHWQPPEAALKAATEAVCTRRVSSYGPDDGLPELKEALLEKLRKENGLHKSSVMVTAGANQAFTNIVLTLCDPDDAVVLFVPYYFNHLMAFQMTGLTDIRCAPSHPATLLPRLDWLQAELAACAAGERRKPKVVVIVNPSNPTGAVVPRQLLEDIAEECRAAGVWLVVDNTYEYFLYDSREHVCLEGSHILNTFSFSKAYGMMGWRVGYIAYPTAVDGLGDELLKVQDTVPICPSIIGQLLALKALEQGPEWVRSRVRGLVNNRRLVKEALAPLGDERVRGGEGAIYFWAELPQSLVPAGSKAGTVPDDVAVVQWLVRRHGVCTIPGSACGSPGHIRLAFANLGEEACRLAARRLWGGMRELLEDGMVEGPRVQPPPHLRFSDE